MSAPTLPIEGIQVFRGWDEHRIPGDHKYDNILTWNTPTEAGVTHVEIWALSYTTAEMYLLATVAADVEQITSDPDIYTILRSREFQTYTLRAKNSDGVGPWSNAPHGAVKAWDGNPNHPADANEIGFLTGLEVVNGSDVKITWADPGSNSPYGIFVSSGVRVYRSIVAGYGIPSSFVFIGDAPTTGPFIDTTVAQVVRPGQIVQYGINILDSRGRISSVPQPDSPYSNRISWSQDPVTEGVGFLSGFFTGNNFKLNWTFLKVYEGTIFEIQRARPRTSGNPAHFIWNTFDTIPIHTAYVGDYLDAEHGLYEFLYPDDISTQWAFRVLARTSSGAEYFSTPTFLTPAAPTFVVRHVYYQYYTFQISHPAFYPNTDAYYKTMKAYYSVNGGEWKLLWTLDNLTSNPALPFYATTAGVNQGVHVFGGGLGSFDGYPTPYLFPIPTSNFDDYKNVNAGVETGIIQFKAVVSATDNFDGSFAELLSPVYSFDQLS